MLIILSLYALIAWLIFSKFKLLPWNRAWKFVVYGIALVIGLVVVGALQYYTPVSKTAVVQGHSQKIFPVVGGQVERVFVSGTQSVRAGDELFRINPDPYQYALDQRAAALELAKISMRDSIILVEKQAAPRASLDLYKSQLDQAQALYNTAEYELENTLVIAPADGTVSFIALYEGEVVSTSTPLLHFFRTGDRWIAASFKQNGLENMEVGSPVTVLFSSAPGEIYESSIIMIAPDALQGQLTAQSTMNPLDSVLSVTALYPVKIAFPEHAPSHLQRTGIQASVTVFTHEGNPINVLAKIVQWIGTWMAFIF